MRRLLFDTTFLIDGEQAGSDLDEVIDDDDDVAIAAVTIAELRVGVLLADHKRKAARNAFVDDVVASGPSLN
jgi:tRNA(fMet)-specific endonuclease VapC